MIRTEVLLMWKKVENLYELVWMVRSLGVGVRIVNLSIPLFRQNVYKEESSKLSCRGSTGWTFPFLSRTAMLLR